MRAGIYRRRIQSSSESGLTRVLLEDDPHCYRLDIQIDNEKVREIDCKSIRTPWSLCRDAEASLQELVGMQGSSAMQCMLKQVDRSRHCTHMLDAAVLGISHAVRGVQRRQYDIAVTCWSTRTAQNVNLSRDGERLFDLEIFDNRVVSPIELRGTSVKSLNDTMVSEDDSDDHREAVAILRRAIYIAGNRQGDLDDFTVAIDVSPGLGACYVYHKDRAGLATRNRGTTRDFTHSTDEMIRLDNID